MLETLHKPIRKMFLRRKTVVAGIDTQWQADLAYLSKLSKSNDKHRYLLCIIDVFSKYAWVVPIKDKAGETLVIAFKSDDVQKVCKQIKELNSKIKNFKIS